MNVKELEKLIRKCITEAYKGYVPKPESPYSSATAKLYPDDPNAEDISTEVPDTAKAERNIMLGMVETLKNEKPKWIVTNSEYAFRRVSKVFLERGNQNAQTLWLNMIQRVGIEFVYKEGIKTKKGFKENLNSQFQGRINLQEYVSTVAKLNKTMIELHKKGNSRGVKKIQTQFEALKKQTIKNSVSQMYNLIKESKVKRTKRAAQKPNDER